MPPNSILIVLMGSIGDVVRGLAIVEPLRKSFPQARITWLVEPTCSSLVRAHPLIDEIIVFDRARPLRGLMRLISDLRSRSFDLSLDLQRHFKSGFFALLSRTPRRVGFHRSNAKEFNWIFQTEHIEAALDDVPKLRHYLLFLKALGVSVESDLRFGIAEKEPPQSAKTLLSEPPGSFVAMVLGSSWKSKDWLTEGYQKLVSQILRNTPYCIVLCGDSSHTKRAGDIVAQAGSPRVINFVGRTTLLDLGYILKQARACVGPDSGPAHISAAVGTPHVTLFGPTSPVRVAPFGSEAFSLQSTVGCAPCYRKSCPGLDRVCMRLLSVDSVWERLQAALAQRGRLAQRI